MELVTRRGAVKEAVRRIRTSAERDLGILHDLFKTVEVIRKLDALGDEPSPEDFITHFPEYASVIHLRCCSCNKDVEQLVRWGWNHGGVKFTCCGNCLILALNVCEEEC